MRKLLLSIVAGFALAGCGSGDDSNDVYRPPPTAGGSIATKLIIESSAPSMPSDGSLVVDIRVSAVDANNVLLAGVPVTLAATSGSLTVPSPAVTSATGEIIVTLDTRGDATVRTITVTARSGVLTASTLVQVEAAVASAPPSVSKGTDTGANKASVRQIGAASVQAGLSQPDGAVFAQSEVIYSSAPCVAESLDAITALADAPAAFIGVPGTDTVQILFADLNGNPLGSGTTISASVDGAGISLDSPGSFTVPCTSEPTAYPFTITKTGAVTSGALTITVTSPSGVESQLAYPIG